MEWMPTAGGRRLEGKVCLVTGASSGIGQATALGLARLGAAVVMVCRDRVRGERVRSEILRKSGNPSVEVRFADLSVQASVRSLCEGVRGAYARLDVLVNNAGTVQASRSVTPDGIEATLAVNHLAPFLLTNLLLDLLRQSAPARIITVASSAHRRASGIDDLQSELSFAPMQAYGKSKLGNLLFTVELARRLEGTGVTANCVDPGLVRTRIFRNFRGPFRVLIEATSPFYRTPEKGAETILYLAASPALAGVTGRYFKDRREIEPTAAAHDPVLARQLWQESERLTHKQNFGGIGHEGAPSRVRGDG